LFILLVVTFFLQTKAAKENNKDWISFRSRHAGRSSAADIDNTASVLLKKRCGSLLALILMSVFFCCSSKTRDATSMRV